MSFQAEPGGDVDPVIRLEQVGKIYYTDDLETHALSGVHLEIRRGEFVSIMGPSGCGKSTLLGILGLLDSPSSGQYLLGGVAVHGLDGTQRAKLRSRDIGFIFQAFNLIGDLTVYENVELPLRLRGGIGATERSRRAVASLDRVGMTHRLKHYPAQLSGGQQQRVAVARALVTDPALILADEPTGALDSRSARDVMRLMEELNEAGRTIMLITHDAEVASAAERIVRIRDGLLSKEKEPVG
jgi:putative ABC transport system ATP-binding protein